MKTTFPEDLSTLSNEELETLRTAGLEEFDSIYTEDFASLDDTAVSTLSSLTENLERVTAELAARQAKLDTLASVAAKRDEFAKVTGTFEGETVESDDRDDAEDDMTAGDAAGGTVMSVTPKQEAASEVVAYATGDGLGVSIDAPLTWDQLGVALDKRLASFNVTPYAQAAQSGRPLKQVQSFAAFKQNIPDDLIVKDTSRNVLRKAIEAARDTSRLQGGSLIASGGWGAPSPIDYSPFRKLSSRAGLASFPTIGVERGGLQITPGTSFAEVFASPDYISFDEDQDIAGEYEPASGGNVVGSKPVYRITPSEWTDYRLEVDGVHIQAGILENRGYPEGITNEVAQVLDAHVHKINSQVIAKAVTGSTAITMTAAQVGAVAPTLTAVELQVLHYRDTHRMELDAELELKIPFWVKGLFRADLSRRLGVDLLDVSDARIDGFFADRGVAVEYVYDWQSIATTAATSFVAYPENVSFLLYAAGTWVKGTSEVISLDTMYDSTLIGTNDYTVLFTEEGWFLAKAGHDSRVITTSVNATGAAHIGVEIARSGAEAA